MPSENASLSKGISLLEFKRFTDLTGAYLSLLLTVFIGTAVRAADNSTVQLRSLKDTSQLTLTAEERVGQIMIFFQKDCDSCRSQVRDLKCLPQDKILLIGAFSTERALRTESQKMRTPLPPYYADQSALKTLKITEALTPQILIFGRDKNHLLQGRTACSSLKKQHSDLQASTFVE